MIRASSIAARVPLWVETRLLAHAVRHGLWRSLARRSRPPAYEQQVLTWPTLIPDLGDASEIIRHLREAGLRVREGSNTFYLPPQPRLAEALGSAVEHYPPGSGYKVLRDFRGLEEAHYLRPDRQTPLRRRLIGTPRQQLIAANYLHRLDLAPRIWDVCLFRAGQRPMPVFVVQHVEGTPPSADECSAFLERLRATLSETDLRITIPNWERTIDFRCPTCNDNLLRDASGAVSYIDFQNFTVRNPPRILPSRDDGGPGPWSFGPWRGLRPVGADGIAGRFHTIRGLLRQHGLELTNRLVLDIGCRTGVMLHHALAAGAWWALGWDQPAPALRAQAIAVALGFTRLDITQAELNDRYDLRASIPDWLDRHLDESIVFFLAARPHLGIPSSLIDLPWRALVYEGPHGRSPAEARDHVGAFLRRGVRVAEPVSARDADSGEAPLFLLIREPAAAPSLPPAIRL